MLASSCDNSIDLPSDLPDQNDIIALSQRLQHHIRKTPTCSLYFPDSTLPVLAKMEVWQLSGSFKIRGALHRLMSLTEEERARGVITASAGNHALALSHAAKIVPTTVKLCMPKHANIIRVNQCRALGSEVVFSDNFSELFENLKKIQREENLVLAHPFDGPYMLQGAATLGMEIAAEMPNLDALIVAIGGGGLIAGVSYAMKMLQPKCKIYGVEPTGANSMSKSFAANKAIALDSIDTIAQSLSAPAAMHYSFSVANKFVDKIVQVTDDEILSAMKLLIESAKLAVEPAAAASIAALHGPLKQDLKDKRVGVIMCGSNMSVPEMSDYLKL